MTVSSGIAMEIHYCMGEKAGIDFYKLTDDKCGRCGMKEQDKKGCCSDEHKFYKLADSHQKAIHEYSFNIGESAVVSPYPLIEMQVSSTGSATLINNHSPPGYLKPPARILHGVFRI